MTEEQYKLVENNVGLVRKAMDGIYYGKDKSEFMSIGYDALCTAATRYDPSKGRFSSFAYSCIHNAYLVEVKRRKRWNDRVVDIFEKENKMEDGWTFEDKISEKQESFEEKYIDHVTAQEILQIVNSVLSEEDQKALVAVIKYGNYSDAADSLCVSRQRIHQRMDRIRATVLKYYNKGLKK